MLRDDDSPDAVGARIRRLREVVACVDQTTFARECGLMRPDVSKWEAGTQRPSIAKARRIIDRYGVDLDWLMLGRADHLRHDIAVLLQ